MLVVIVIRGDDNLQRAARRDESLWWEETAFRVREPAPTIDDRSPSCTNYHDPYRVLAYT